MPVDVWLVLSQRNAGQHFPRGTRPGDSEKGRDPTRGESNVPKDRAGATTAAAAGTRRRGRPVQPAGAAKPTITATGSVNCAITGKIKISPPLEEHQHEHRRRSPASSRAPAPAPTRAGVTPTKAKIGITLHGERPRHVRRSRRAERRPVQRRPGAGRAAAARSTRRRDVKGFVLTGVPNFGFDLPNPNARPALDGDRFVRRHEQRVGCTLTSTFPDTSVCEPTTQPTARSSRPRASRSSSIKPGSTLSASAADTTARAPEGRGFGPAPLASRPAPAGLGTLRRMRALRRGLVVLFVAVIAGGLMKLRGKGGVPPTSGGWRELEGPEFR